MIEECLKNISEHFILKINGGILIFTLQQRLDMLLNCTLVCSTVHMLCINQMRVTLLMLQQHQLDENSHIPYFTVHTYFTIIPASFSPQRAIVELPDRNLDRLYQKMCPLYFVIYQKKVSFRRLNWTFCMALARIQSCEYPQMISIQKRHLFYI